MSILESIGSLLSRRALTDEETINRAAVRSARGDEPRTDREITTIAEALQRLGKDQNYLAEKIEIVKRHDEAEAREATHRETVSEAEQVRAEYDALDKEIAPHMERLRAIGDRLAPLEQQVAHERGPGRIIGRAAELREKHAELFAEAK